MKFRKENTIYLLAITAMVCWAFSFIWTKSALLSFPPVTLISLRLLLASILMFAYQALRKSLIRIDKKDIKLFVLLAFFEPFLYYIGETYGLTLVKATTASVIVATIPIFAPFFAFVFLRERFTIINILGILVSLYGVFLIVNSTNSGDSTSLSGVMLLFVAVFSAVIYGLILRKIPSKYSATNIVLYQNIFGLIFFIPTALWVDSANYSSIIFYRESLQALILLTIFASIFAFVLFSIVVRKIGLTKSQVFTNLIPVFTALFSWILFNDRLTTLQWIGIFVVVLGVFVSQGKIKYLNRLIKIPDVNH